MSTFSLHLSSDDPWEPSYTLISHSLWTDYKPVGALSLYKGLQYPCCSALDTPRVVTSNCPGFELRPAPEFGSLGCLDHERPHHPPPRSCMGLWFENAPMGCGGFRCDLVEVSLGMGLLPARAEVALQHHACMPATQESRRGPIQEQGRQWLRRVI